MFDYKNVKHLSSKQIKRIYDENTSNPLDDKALVEIIKSLAEK